MLNLIAAAATDPGQKREMNEDRAWAQVFSPSEGEAIGLFIVCDGMGGHLAGECASHWAVETIRREFMAHFTPKDPRATRMLPPEEVEAQTRRSPVSELETQVRQAIQKANSVVYEYARQKPQQAQDAGTTATLAFVRGSQAVIANVGDSRTYLLRNRQLHQVSKDHSLVSGLVASGQITPEELYTHPQRNVVYRSLGQKGQVKVDTFLETLYPGDTLLLCSDGLWEMFPDASVIVRLLEGSSDPAQACRNLIAAANAAGGDDNIGVVVVKAV